MVEYKVIGVMSGTSLDGLDIALCTFQLDGSRWRFSIDKGVTYPYSLDWRMKLESAATLPGYQLMMLHNEFGRYIGGNIIKFLVGSNVKMDIIASHGHTVFHQPGKGLTLQIGSGASIASITGISTLYNFRALDVALGGQGAPLVPVGDKLLFDNYRYCLNLGGFANISFDDEGGNRVAFDICPVNILLNHFAKETGLDYDLNGAIGRSGVVSDELLKALNRIEFYELSGPKSLGREWVWGELLPILHSFEIPINDKMRTIYQHVAFQIFRIFEKQKSGNILISGGGAWNTFLMELLRDRISLSIEIPDKRIIDYKEALVFAFLGLLRYRNEINCLRSVTGASKDSSCGEEIIVN